MQPQARTLALSILNYQRNHRRQRQRDLASQQHPQPKPLPHIGARHAVPLPMPEKRATFQLFTHCKALKT